MLVVIQLESSILQAICERFGAMRCFLPTNGDFIVNYARIEDAVNAQRTLPTLLPGISPPLVADFISDADVLRVLEMGAAAAAAAAASRPLLPDQSNLLSASAASPWSQPGASVWSTEETHGYLPSDLFGGQ